MSVFALEYTKYNFNCTSGQDICICFVSNRESSFPPIFAQFLKFVVELEDMLGQQLSNLEGKYSWILLSLLFSFSFAQVVRVQVGFASPQFSQFS